jgi:DNA-binding beta-propeller fold protein YncE
LRPGPLTDGSELLPTGWRIKPAGTQVETGSFPLGSALSPDGKFLLVTNAGSPSSVSVIRTDTLAQVGRTPVPEAWQGIAFAPDGKVYVSGGAQNSVFEFTLSPEGTLSAPKEMPGASAGGFIADIAFAPGGRLAYATDMWHDQVLVFNPQSGRVIERFKSGRRPYRIVFHPNGRSYFISSWADGTVYQYSTEQGEEITRLRVAPHPTGMVISARKLPDEPNGPPVRLFVAAANTNNVFVIGVDANNLMKQMDVLNIGFSPSQPSGMAPGSLALSKDETRLFVSCANVNAIAVADISELRSTLIGFIPTDAHPSSVRLLNDNRLAITNAHADNISVIPAITDTTLPAMTNQAIDLVAFDPAETAPAAPPAENAMLIFIDEKSRGANFAKLAKRFSTATNFYATAPGLEGIGWATSGVPSDYAQLLRGRMIATNDPANLPPAGTLLTNARQAGLTVGEFGPAMPQSLPPELPRYTQIRLFGADADRSLGQIVATLSKSPLWAKTAVFVVSDSLTTPLVVISPYAHTSPVPDGMFYNHSSVLRTIELILKLRPMTMFDASARPLTELFSSTAQSDPYTAEP